MKYRRSDQGGTRPSAGLDGCHAHVKHTLPVLIAAVLAVPAAGELPPQIPVRTLFSNPQFSAPEISDDGKTLAFVVSQGDLQIIYSRAVQGGTAMPLVKFDEPQTRLRWLDWANSERLLISAEARDRDAVGVRSRVTRLFAVNHDGSDFAWLGRRWPRFGQAQIGVFYQDQVIHLTPDDPQHVLIEYQSPYESASQVMRLAVSGGALKLAQESAHDISAWHADRSGAVRAGVAYRENRYELWARADAGKDLELVASHRIFDEEGPEFVGFHSDPQRIYVRHAVDGRDVISEFDLATRSLGEIAFSHPAVDAGDIERDPGREKQAVGVRFVVDRPEIHFFDAEAEREHRGLRAALDLQLGIPTFHRRVSASADGAQQILEVSSDTLPPVYFLYDRTKRAIGLILKQWPDIDTKQLAATRRVTYRARDGLEIPAYLTLPLGVEPKGLPVIALIHGGPWSRDLIQWDPEVQLFANRGFAVFQMNFRGSTGLGRSHLKAGFREWGQKIQDDITDGVKWLIAEGIADPGRIGITGASYGGYATLVGLVKTPDLYRAGAAYAPVTDIEFLISDDKWYEWGYEWHGTMVGGGRADRDRLRASSPLRRAAEIRVPVLIGHGQDDQRVHVRQSRRMAEALRAAGKDHTYLEFPDEVHGFQLEANRIRWYEALIAFFEQNVAAPAGAAKP